MIRAGAFFVALLLPCVLSARIKHTAKTNAKTNAKINALAHQAKDSAQSGLAWCPPGVGDQFVTFRASREVRRACGTSAWGTLYIGIIGARDLTSADWTSTSDAWARFRISDRHIREMRGFWAKDKPVQVTDDMSTDAKSNNANPTWKKTFAVDLLCPQLPFGPDAAPLGGKPPMVASHPIGYAINDGKSGHEFQLELTVKDADIIGSTTIGRVKLPLTDIISGKYTDTTTYEVLNSDGNTQGTVDMLVFYCEKDDEECEEDRTASWQENGLEDRVTGRTRFDCQMGCHTLLDPSGGRIAAMAQEADSELRQAIGNAESAEQWANRADEYDEQADGVVSEAMYSRNHNETVRLVAEYSELEELEEAADREAEQSHVNREVSWTKAKGLARQLAEVQLLGAQYCSASPLLSDTLSWAGAPLFNYVYGEEGNYLRGQYNARQAEELMTRVAQIQERLTRAQTCLKDRWFEEGQLIVNQWETTESCHSYFNLPSNDWNGTASGALSGMRSTYDNWQDGTLDGTLGGHRRRDR